MGMFDTGNFDWGQIADGFGAAGGPNFDQRFGAAFPQTNPIPPSPISPDALAKNLAARGVPPPPVDAPANVGAALTGNAEPFRMADQPSVDAWRAGVDVKDAQSRFAGNDPTMTPPAAAPAAGGTAPMNINTPVQQAAVDAATGTPTNPTQPGKLDKFAQALSGIKAPPAPTIQHLGTPAAPKPSGVKVAAPQLLALLQSLNSAPGAEARKLPATLGQALIGRG